MNFQAALRVLHSLAATGLAIRKLSFPEACQSQIHMSYACYCIVHVAEALLAFQARRRLSLALSPRCPSGPSCRLLRRFHLRLQHRLSDLRSPYDSEYSTLRFCWLDVRLQLLKFFLSQNVFQALARFGDAVVFLNQSQSLKHESDLGSYLIFSHGRVPRVLEEGVVPGVLVADVDASHTDAHLTAS